MFFSSSGGHPIGKGWSRPVLFLGLPDIVYPSVVTYKLLSEGINDFDEKNTPLKWHK